MASDSPLACAVSLGWKQVSAGLQVATIFDGQGSRRHIVLPNVLLARFARADELRGQLDRATNESFEWLASSLPTNLPEPLRKMSLELQGKHPHRRRFAQFVWTWKEQETSFEPTLLKEADRRRKKIKRVEAEIVNLREKVRRRRLDFYRNEAKNLAEKYGTIVVDSMDLRQLAALEAPDGTPNELAKIARKHRGWASISELREWIEKQAAKSGAVMLKKKIATTLICHVCCAIQTRPADGLPLICSTCGVFVGQ